jgi:small subunit ribosomal protein S33
MPRLSIKPFSPALLSIIDEASRKCFGNRPIVNFRTGFKILKRRPIGPVINDYYIPNMAPMFRKVDPGFKTELEERRYEKLIKLRAKGKGPPKKGQGKRSKKKK